MGSLANYLSQSTSPNNTSDMNLGSTTLAELNDGDYLTEVLRRADRVSEADIERALERTAETLGISIRPHTPTQHTNGSADSPLSSHGRNTSTGSNDTTHTALTTVPSTPSIPCAEPHFTPSPSPRSRARSLTFSQYDKYLAQVEPSLVQPKFLKQTSPSTDALPSLFGATTRKSVMSIKNGIKAKVRWKKRASLSSTAALMYAFLSERPGCWCAVTRKISDTHVLDLLVLVYVAETISPGKTTSRHYPAVTRTAAIVSES